MASMTRTRVYDSEEFLLIAGISSLMLAVGITLCVVGVRGLRWLGLAFYLAPPQPMLHEQEALVTD